MVSDAARPTRSAGSSGGSVGVRAELSLIGANRLERSFGLVLGEGSHAIEIISAQIKSSFRVLQNRV